MKLRKIITMGLAAIMAVSAMSISVFATDTSVTEEKELITCTAVSSGNVAKTFDVAIPNGLSSEERDNYIVAAAANALNPQSTITYSQRAKATNFSVPKNGETTNSTEGPFTDITIASNVCAFAVKFERKTGGATSYNARFDYVNAFDSSDKRSSYLNKAAASGNCTILFTDGASCYPNDMVVNSKYVYDVFVSANTSGGKADITLMTGVQN